MAPARVIRTIATVFFGTIFFISCIAPAQAADIEYRILINGVDAEQHQLAPGTHTLTVEGIVTNNEIPGAGPGGFLQSSFDLTKSSDAAVFVVETVFLNGPPDLWTSTANDTFLLNNRGAELNGNIIQETNSILQSQWNTRFNSVGANEFSFIAEGPFMWDGSQNTRIDLTSTSDVNRVAVLGNAAIAAAVPDGTVTGDSAWLIVPEPGTILLVALGLISSIAVRASKCGIASTSPLIGRIR